MTVTDSNRKLRNQWDKRIKGWESWPIKCRTHGIIRSAIPGKCSEVFPLFQHLEPLLLPLLGHPDCFHIYSLWALPISNSGHSVPHLLCSTISPSPHQTGILTSSAIQLSAPGTFSNLFLQHQFPSVILYSEPFPSHRNSSGAS